MNNIVMPCHALGSSSASDLALSKAKEAKAVAARVATAAAGFAAQTVASITKVEMRRGAAKASGEGEPGERGRPEEGSALLGKAAGHQR